MQNRHLYSVVVLLLAASLCRAQVPNEKDSVTHLYKNIIRYDLSGALFFGIEHHIVLGYERMVAPRQSFSINIGRASLPKLVSIETDSFSLNKDQKRDGFNISVDYRFYLPKENKYAAPHGFYIGPYYSFNHFTRDNEWTHKNGNANNNVTSHTDFNIHTVGFELGYQLIIWKRMILDFIMVGPGMGFYKYEGTFEGNMDAGEREQLLDGLKQLLTQRFPGMNFVFSGKTIDANGVLKTNAMGYRYIIHIGFNF